MKPAVIESIHHFVYGSVPHPIYKIRIWYNEEEVKNGYPETRARLQKELHMLKGGMLMGRLAEALLNSDNVNAVEVIDVSHGMLFGEVGIVLYKEWP